MLTIATVVEGDGEVKALPLLLRRIAASLGSTVHAPRPIRVKRDKVVKAGELERAVELAARQAKEAIKGAKGWLRKRMPRDQRYRETLDQAALSAIFDLDAARSAPSFDKPWRDVASLLVG